MLDLLFWLVVIYLAIGILVLVVYKSSTPERFWLVLTWPVFLWKQLTTGPGNSESG